MKATKVTPVSILLYGHNEHLAETRKWVLESRGYRVLSINQLAAVSLIARTVPIELLLLCGSLLPEEAAGAEHVARSRWPDVRILRIPATGSRVPSGLLGQLLHTMEGPAQLIAMVDKLVGAGRSSAA